MKVVGLAEGAQVLEIVRAAEGEWLDVIDLHSCSRFAADAGLFGDEFAPAAGALEDLGAEERGDDAVLFQFGKPVRQFLERVGFADVKVKYKIYDFAETAVWDYVRKDFTRSLDVGSAVFAYYYA